MVVNGVVDEDEGAADAVGTLVCPGSVGISVGLCVGFEVGTIVRTAGDAVGLAVGASVDTGHQPCLGAFEVVAAVGLAVGADESVGVAVVLF